MARALFILIFCSVSVFSARADPVTPYDLARDGAGKVLFIRHAYAPGVGDPDHFKLGDCSTQRNLDAAGRLQARKIGEVLRNAGVRVSKVYSSQWCRCLETARLMNVGAVTPFSGLNSFHDFTETREENLANVETLLAGLDRNGPLVIMVTHAVTISALAGMSVGSGEGVVLSLKDRSFRAVSGLN